MMRVARKFVAAVSISMVGIVALALAAHVSFAQQSTANAAKSAQAMEPIPALTPFVEEHAHFDETDPVGSVRSALTEMGRENAAMILFQISPDTFDHPGHYDSEVILAEVKKHPGKLAITGGGGSLNSIIMQSVATGDAGPAVQKKFKDRADELLREGVVGFGEMTAEHFSGYTPYQYAPMDHPLYLMLADIAAAHHVPIDLHMEAVPQDMALPAGLKSPPNAPRLHANIAAFERFLSHNPNAKVIWAHLGSDFTGFRTVDLDRRLLAAHPNLYMEIKTDPVAPGLNYPLAADGKIKPEWLKLFTDFPDRFVIGSDQHYPEPKGEDRRWQEVILLFNQLPANVRKKIGTENVASIYGNAVATYLRAAKN
ncbi:MAG TPA: amidohydrolase family protein [Candidatus Acidoferrales bacterium]|jgi:predicted TIM-barrel fold metal-dependent hydrolase|nr:amidohydrolase family protein [Candidatus Acidoferrales bacterium]